MTERTVHEIKEIIQEAEPLPVEESKAEIDREWVKVTKRRLAKLRSGGVKPIRGNEVFAKVRKRRLS